MKTLRLLHCLPLPPLFSLPALLLLTFCAFGQTPSTKGNFEVNYIKGCPPLAVTATNTSGYDPTTTPIVWNMNWDGDTTKIFFSLAQSSQQADTVYSDPGIYKILQVIGTIGGAQLDTITIEVMEPLPPKYKVYNCVDNSIYVDVSQEDYYDRLKIEYGDGSIPDTITVADMPGKVHDYSPVGPGTYQVKVEGIFENASTNCSQDSVMIKTLDQSALEVAQVNQLEVLDQNRFQIDYQLPNPDIAYQLQLSRNGDTNFSFAVYDLDSNSTSFIVTDSTINTRNDYFCFRIAAVDFCNDSQMNSDTLCSIALQGTAGNLVNNLSWKTNTTDFLSYQVFKDSIQDESTDLTVYADSNVQCLEQYAYQVTAQKNGMNSLSELITLTAVSQDTLVAIDTFSIQVKGLGIALNWKDMPGAKQYYIYREGGGAPLQIIDSVENALTYLDQQVETDVDYCYQVSYQDACGNESRLSIQFCDRIPRQAQIFFPTAFTPNGDGLNDVFLYKGNLIERIELQIFNRWGEMVFATDQADVGWDGIYRGAPAPQGTYIYQVKVTDELGKQFQQRGSFTLLIPKR